MKSFFKATLQKFSRLTILGLAFGILFAGYGVFFYKAPPPVLGAVCGVGHVDNGDGTCTATFYPDAHPEVASVDGFVGRSLGPSESWSTIRAGAGNVSSDTGNQFLGSYIQADTTPGRYIELYRGIFLFDTSSLQTTYTINSATFEFVATQKTDELGGDSLSLVTSTPASNTALANSDYTQLGIIRQAADLPIASILADSSTYNPMSLNAAGLASITKGGVSKFGVRSTFDMANSPEPTWVSGGFTRVRIASAEEILAGDKRPKLVVIYTPEPPPPFVTTNNVSGYAWSANIGWVSFNCTDAGTCTTIDYGVNIREDKYFEGYAWSENIGWISFKHADTGNPPGEYNYSAQGFLAQFQNGINEVYGWARALAGMNDPTDGWDGWIKTKKHPSDAGSSYGVTINGTTGEFHGWAWGGEVVGWLSFNCEEGGSAGENICGQSQYQVVVDPSFLTGSPPTAAISCNPASCIGFTTGGLVLNNNSTDPDGQGDIVQSAWTGIPPAKTCPPGPALCNYTTQVVAVNNYTVQLRVEDASGNFDTAQVLVTIKQDIVSNFDCSLDGLSWQSCVTIKVSQGEVVRLRNLSTPSQGASITSRSWSFQDGNPATSSSQNPTVIFQASGNKAVSLQVEDSAGRIGNKQVFVGVSLPFPEWQEVSPF
jgi:hypothetical protein